jgi:hypothetical protein
MKTILSTLGPVFLLACAFLPASPSAAEKPLPTEASLREAWEKKQREDPKTEVFEKLAEDRYRFKTARFPFDGELRVLSADVGDPVEFPGDEGFVMGTVNVELVGAGEELTRLHPQGYGLWTATHTLYFDEKGGRWLTAKEFSARARRKVSCASSWFSAFSGGLFWILFLGILGVSLWILTRKTTRQMNSAMAAQEKALAEQARAMKIAERGLELTEDSNRLLREIRDALGDRKGN